MQLVCSLSTVAYLLHDFLIFPRGMSVFAVCRSFLPVAFVRVSHTGAICTTRTLTATICCDVHVFGDRTCECRADVIKHTLTWCNAREKWRTDRMRIKLIGKVVRRMCHEEIVVTIHGNSGAAEVVSLRVAHGEVRDPVGCAYQSDIPKLRRFGEFAECRCSAQLLR